MQFKSWLVLATAVVFANADIARDEILQRAEFWVSKHIPYSMKHYAPDPQGVDYRTDCSGFVSMALKAGPPGLSTVTLPTISHPITWEELLPGDLVGTLGPGTGGAAGHVTLFHSWVDASHTAYHTLECKGDAGCVAYQRKKGWTDGPFTAKPYRYNHVANPPPPPHKTTSKVPTHSPTETKTKPSETKTKPSETKMKPSESKTKPTETKTNPSETKTKPTSSATDSAVSTSAPHNSTSTTSTTPVKTTTIPSGNSTSTTWALSTTSTVYTTTVHTIISCHATVTNCPARSTVLVTETIPAYTTVCPVTENSAGSAAPTGPIVGSSMTQLVAATGVVPSKSSGGAVTTVAPVVAGSNKLTCAGAVALGAFAVLVL